MKPSALQGTMLVCLFLAIQIKAAEVSFIFYYSCYYSPCSIIIWFSDYWLESFGDCLCSALTSACTVYYAKTQGYYQANEIHRSTLKDISYLPAQFTCRNDTYNSRAYIQCYRTSSESGNTFNSLRFTTRTCDLRCVGMISSDIYDIYFDYNKIIYYDDSTTICSSIATTVTTVTSAATQKPTTSGEHSTTTSITATALSSVVANTTKLTYYNHSQTNTSGFGDTRNVHDNITDIGLITGVIFATVAVISIVLVILFLWRRRIRQLNQAESKDKSKLSETRVTVSDHNVVTFSANNDQTYTEVKEEKKVQIDETNGDYQKINSEHDGECATIKKKTEPHSNIVPTPIKQEVNMCPPPNDIYSLASVYSTEVVLDDKYCNVNRETTQGHNSHGKPNLNKTSKSRSECTYTNIQRSPENQVEKNNMKDTHPVNFDHLAHINNALSDNESSTAYANTPPQTTAEVYAKLGDQNKELTNPYNTLLDKSG